jgi:hypothetical protein
MERSNSTTTPPRPQSLDDLILDSLSAELEGELDELIQEQAESAKIYQFGDAVMFHPNGKTCFGQYRTVVKNISTLQMSLPF